MSHENEPIVKIKPKQEHVALFESSSQKLKMWLEQIATKKKGVKISRKDFINWLIEKSPENLSHGDVAQLIDRFYDEAAFLRGLLRDLKQAKKNGKTESGFELVVKTKKPEIKRELIDENTKNETYLEQI